MKTLPQPSNWQAKVALELADGRGGVSRRTEEPEGDGDRADDEYSSYSGLHRERLADNVAVDLGRRSSPASVGGW